MGLKIACIQYRSGTDPQTNIDQAHHLTHHISLESPDIIVLPEHTFFLGRLEDFRRYARPLDLEHPWMRLLKKWSKEFNTTLIAGSLPEMASQKNLIYQTAAVVFPDERSPLFFRKRLLFKGIGKSIPIDESSVIDRGTEPYLAFNLNGWRIGLTLCVELRYSPIFHSMRFRDLCDLAIVPASFYASTGCHHYLPLLTARAIEFQMYVASANQCATPNENPPTFIGQSCIIDPWGKLLSVAHTQAEALCFQELHKEKIQLARSTVDMTENINQVLLG
jgi:predicted amidohydrolase